MPEVADKQCMLLVDDDPLIVDSLSILLRDEYEVITAATRKQVKSQLQKLDKMPSIYDPISFQANFAPKRSLTNW